MKVNKDLKYSFIIAIFTSISFGSIFHFETVGIIALFVFFQQFYLFIFQISNQIPFRTLFGMMMSLQMLLGPSLVYNGLEQFQSFKMSVTQAEYFNYVLPAVIFFIIGINYKSKNSDEYIDRKGIEAINDINPALPFVLIIIGFFSSIFYIFFSSDLAFIFYILSTFKFIGLFILLFKKNRLRIQWLLLIYGSIVISSIAGGMFFDLLAWTIFLGIILAIKYRIKFGLKVVGAVIFILLALSIQAIKSVYRDNTWNGIKDASISTLNESALQVKSESDGFFSFNNIAPMATRINQGWIISAVLDNVPRAEPFANGELLVTYLQAAFLPRILAPDKLKSGDQKLFTKYTGHSLEVGTSMGLSSVADGYINFGIYGGWFFMFIYGLIFNLWISFIGKRSKNYPLLIIFSISIFFYPFRAECELQTILTHLIKSSLIIYFIFLIFNKYFKAIEYVK